MTANLVEVLSRAQRLGFIGSGPLEPAIAQAELMTEFVAGLGDGPVLDLGSGGGLPGLVLGLGLVDRTVTLTEVMERRATFLRWAVGELALSARVMVAEEAVEILGRGELAGRFSVVTARGFGPPAVTAECATPFLDEGGVLVVTEPRRSRSWSSAGLAELGFGAKRTAGTETFPLGVIERVGPPRLSLPRSVGRARRDPVF